MGRNTIFKALLVLTIIVRDATAVSLTQCSSENTADGSATFARFQTNGLCSDSCGSNYAFAITQGGNCWCSNVAPGSTVSVTSCNEKCPGYPFEFCGSSSTGLFGYIKLAKEPDGTANVFTNRPQQTRSQATRSSTSVSAVTSPPAAETMAEAPVTSIVTLPGQTRVQTVVITPSSAADSSPLGQGASTSISSTGLSKGATAGIAIGVALGVSLIAGVLIWFLWRRMKRRREEAEAAMSPEMAVSGSGGTPSSVSRHTSTLSQAGLLNKHPRINTRNLSSAWGSQGHSAASTISPTATSNRRSLGADQRLDPYHAIYTNEGLRHSDVSLQDNTDYSRKILSVRNRADGELDD